jgi:RHS repeat-associated protein
MVEKRFSDGDKVTIAYGAQNQIVAVANRATSISYEWDAEMRITKETTGSDVLQYEYDAVGNRIALRTSGGRVVRYKWDGRHRLFEMTDTSAIVYRYEYNALNLVTRAIFPHGLVEEFAYDQANRMSRRSVANSGVGPTLTARDFHYDGASRLLEVTDLQRGRVHYTYDRGDRLTEVRYATGRAESYAYDDNDNALVNSRGEAVTIGNGNRVLAAGAFRYEYDECGNQTVKRSPDMEARYEFSLSGELSSIAEKDGAVTEYLYDPLGRRISKKHQDLETRYLWDGASLLSELGANGMETRYLFMPGSFFPAGVSVGEEHHSYSIDHLGTPTEMFDSRGRISWAANFAAFGEQSEQTTFRNPLRFQGQYFDEESKLCYHLHRYYDPQLGRFISQDPIGFDGGPNLYRYVPNPVNWVDPFGLVVCEIQMKCSWSDKQRKEAQKKMDAMNDKIGSGIPIPPAIPASCAARKNAKDIYEDCKKKGHKLPDLQETSSKCSNEQADHIIEVCLGGGEEGCDNLQPLNQSVNASFGSQIANCVKANLGSTLTKVRTKKGPCRPGGRKCPDV